LKPQHSIPIIFLNAGAAMAAAKQQSCAHLSDKKIGDSMDYKDYYKILGVDKRPPPRTSKGLSQARPQIPPRHQQGKRRGARMAEVNEANTVLSDPEKRAAYDAMGDEMQFAQNARAQGGGGFRPPPDWDQQDFHFSSQGDAGSDADFSDFFSQMFGQAARARRHQGQQGARSTPDMRGQDQHASIELDLQDSYSGAVRSLHLRSTVLDDQGIPTHKDKELQVTIPKGVREGQMIRLAGQGNPGLGKGARRSAAGGALSQRPALVVEGKDVYQRVPLAPWEAELGGPVPSRRWPGSWKSPCPPAIARAQAAPQGQGPARRHAR
jgi:curved DNA-binding protein